MDPTALLSELRELCSWEQANGDGSFAEEIVEKFTALDEWISKGGFLPYPWNTPNRK